MSLLYSRLYLILYRIHVFMKMKKLFSYLLLLVFLSAAGCAKKNASAYYSNGVKPDSVYTVEVHTLNDSSIWCFPLQMECIDSLLVILDYMDDCYFHVYTLSGNPKGKFARKGQGPGELLSANQFHLSPGKDTLYVYDGVSRKLVAYNLDTNLERDRSFTEYKIDYSILPPSETPFIIYDLLPLGGNQFLLKANQPNLRYGCINLATKQITSVYKDFPSEYVTGNAEEIWSVFSSDTRTFFKPDYARMFNATYIGGILELFSVGSGWELAMDTTLCIYEPVYGLAEGTVPAFVVGNEKLSWDLKMLMRETSLFMRCCMRKEMRWSLNRSLCLTGRGTLLRKCGPVSVWHVFVWTRRIMSFMHWHRMKKTAISWYVFAVIK